MKDLSIEAYFLQFIYLFSLFEDINRNDDLTLILSAPFLLLTKVNEYRIDLAEFRDKI